MIALNFFFVARASRMADVNLAQAQPGRAFSSSNVLVATSVLLMVMMLSMRCLFVRAAALMSSINLAIAFGSAATAVAPDESFQRDGSSNRSRSRPIEPAAAARLQQGDDNKGGRSHLHWMFLARRTPRNRRRRICFTLPIMPNIQFIARADGAFATNDKGKRLTENVTRGMHPQLAARGDDRLAQANLNRPSFLSACVKNFFAGKELFVEPAGRLEIFPGG